MWYNLFTETQKVNKMIKILGTDDTVTTCDCCGKSNLKHTVIVDVDGEVFNYGSTCATRHTGLKPGQIKSAIEQKRLDARAAASKEFRATPECIAHQAKLAQLTRDKVRPGKEFCEAQRECQLKSNEVQQCIATKYSLDMWEV